ncbi:hypothetical protein ACQ86D_37955 [Streptomyces galilaeus]
MDQQVPPSFPPSPGADRFVRAWDQLVTTRSGHRSTAAALLLLSEGPTEPARAMLLGLSARLVAEDAVLAPHALMEEASGPTTVADLCEQLAADLPESMPPGSGRLRFPSYWLMRDIVGAELTEAPERRGRELRGYLYARHLQRADGGKLLRERLREHGAGVLRPLAVAVDLWELMAGPLFGRRVRRRMLPRRGRGWYARWARHGGRPVKDFFASAQSLAPGGRYATPDRVEQALVRALLGDLDEALRRRPFSPWRRRRGARFVLFFAGADPQQSNGAHAAPAPPGAVRRFLSEYLEAVGDGGSTATSVVVSGDRRLAGDLTAPVGEGTDLETAAQRLQNGIGGEDGAPAVVVVAVPAPEDAPAGAPNGVAPVVDRRADAWLRRHPNVRTETFRWGPRTGLALSAIGTVLVLLGAGVGATQYIKELLLPPCPGDQFLGPARTGCLGLSDGRERFDGMSPEFRPLFKEIAEQNRAADKQEKAGAIVRTVAYVGAITAVEKNQAQQRGVLPELRGVLLAQKSVNAAALADNRKVWLKLLLVNTGPKYAAGVRAAKMVVERRDEDHLAGAVGFGMSLQRNFATMKVFDEASVPMIGTTGTADQLLQQSQQYYQTAPVNDREAAAAALFVSRQAVVVHPDGHRSTAGGAVVVENPSADDIYSRNLAEDFQRRFLEQVQGPVTRLGYAPDGHAVKNPDVTVVDSTSALARRVCDALAVRHDTVVFWAARGPELIAFMNDFQVLPTCGGKLTVLGGDDITNSLVAEARPTATYSNLTLYHVAHAVPVLDEPNVQAKQFDSLYEKEFGTQDGMFTDGWPALGFDALNVLSRAVNESYQNSGSKAFDRATISSILHSGIGQVHEGIQGATGVFSFNGTQNSTRVPLDKPLYVVHDTDSGPVIAMKCGLFAIGRNVTEWGGRTRHPCPRDTT